METALLEHVLISYPDYAFIGDVDNTATLSLFYHLGFDINSIEPDYHIVTKARPYFWDVQH